MARASVRSSPKRVRRQLELFPSKRVPKRIAPAEFAVHCVIVDVVCRWLSPDWQWTHLPFGEKRPLATAVRLKRMGVKRGWPDFLFVSPEGRHHYLEIKREGGVIQPEQAELHAFFRRAGVACLVSASVPEMIETLRTWGVIRAEARVMA